MKLLNCGQAAAGLLACRRSNDDECGNADYFFPLDIGKSPVDILVLSLLLGRKPVADLFFSGWAWLRCLFSLKVSVYQTFKQTTSPDQQNISTCKSKASAKRCKQTALLFFLALACGSIAQMP